METYDVVILGSGPAGYTAAIYISRGGFKPLVITGNQIGGQLTLTTNIENYPGFPQAVTGTDLMAKRKAQAERFGTVVVTDNISKLEKDPQGLFKAIGRKGEYQGKTVIVATGASALWLDAPGLGKFKGKGISACATCDGPFFKDKTVAVIGGGDTAFIEIEFLIRFTKKVYLIHRREEYRGEKIVHDRVLKNSKVIPLFNTQVKEFLGEKNLDELKLETKFKVQSDKYIDEVGKYPEKHGGKILEKNKEKLIWQLPIDGAFMAIGHKPNTEFLKGFLELSQWGYIETNNEVFTSVEGVFAAGDVIDNKYKQAPIAAGSGCKAGIEAQEWLKGS